MSHNYRDGRGRYRLTDWLSVAWVGICVTLAGVLVLAAAPSGRNEVRSTAPVLRVVPKPIEQIRKGDTVLAHDFRTGRDVARRVEEVHRHHTYYWIDVFLEDESSITATRHHLLWVVSLQAWLEARELQPGMTLRLSNGASVAIATVVCRPLKSPEVTYNFEVAEVQNYYAGTGGLLVHNGPSLLAEGYWNYTLRDAASNIYYHGIGGPNQTLADASYRHSHNHDRFVRKVDQIVREPGVRTYGAARRMEHEGIIRDNTNIGRDPKTWRGNRQNGISDRNIGRYYNDGC